jgi:hypothetical protein
VFGLALVRDRAGRVRVESAVPLRSAEARGLYAWLNFVLEHAEALRLCARCEEPFVSLGKRRFCSPNCTRRAMDERKRRRAG